MGNVLQSSQQFQWSTCPVGVHSSCTLFVRGMVVTKQAQGVTWIQITARLNAMQHFYYMVDCRCHATRQDSGSCWNLIYVREWFFLRAAYQLYPLMMVPEFESHHCEQKQVAHSGTATGVSDTGDAHISKTLHGIYNSLNFFFAWMSFHVSRESLRHTPWQVLTSWSDKTQHLLNLFIISGATALPGLWSELTTEPIDSARFLKEFNCLKC